MPGIPYEASAADSKTPHVALRYCLLYALPDEVRHLKTTCSLRAVRSAGGGERIVWSNAGSESGDRPTGALCIGVGRDRAYRRTALLLQSGPPVDAVVVIGFAGALNDSLPTGSLVLAESVRDFAAGRVLHPDADLTDRLRGGIGKQPIARGEIVTVERVVIGAAEKRRLGRETGALAVDMETAGAASAATDHGVPWVAVRGISDGIDDDLPLDFNALADPDGSVNIARILWSVARRPSKIPALLRLGARAARAARSLGNHIQPLLDSESG